MNMNYKTHPYIEEYFNLIDTEQIVVCKEQMMLKELAKKKLSQPNVYIDAEAIEKAVTTKEKYFYKEFPFQKFIDCFVYGVFYDDGSLVFDEFFIMMGRGNGKNGYVSPTAWYLTTHYNNIEKYNVDIVATAEQQARISFNDIYDMLDKHWSSLKRFHKRTKEVITFEQTRSRISAWTSNAKTKDGLRPGCIIFDEIHAYEDYENIKVFTSALGKTKHPRTFLMTTDGYVRDKVLDDYKREACEVLRGDYPNSKMFPFICKLDSEEEIDKQEMWPKANPAWYYLPNLKDEIIKQYHRSLNNPELRLELHTKRFNLPAQDTMNPVTDWSNIEAASRAIPDFKGRTCIGCLDFAETTDFVGVGLLFKQKGCYYFMHHTFICNESLLKSKPRRINIEEAVEKGLCTIVYEKSVRPEVVAEWFIEKAQTYSILRVACDDFRVRAIREVFEARGIPLDIVRGGSITHNKIAPVVDDKFASHNIIFGDDMLMRWYVNNTYAEYDKKGNKTYKKIENKLRKTDGFFALLSGITSEMQTPLIDYEEYSDEDFKVYVY